MEILMSNIGLYDGLQHHEPVPLFALVAILYTALHYAEVPVHWPHNVLVFVDLINTIVFLYIRRIMVVFDMGVETNFRKYIPTFITSNGHRCKVHLQDKVDRD